MLQPRRDVGTNVTEKRGVGGDKGGAVASGRVGGGAGGALGQALGRFLLLAGLGVGIKLHNLRKKHCIQ